MSEVKEWSPEESKEEEKPEEKLLSETPPRRPVSWWLCADDARKPAKCIAQLLSPVDTDAGWLMHEVCDAIFSMVYEHLAVQGELYVCSMLGVVVWIW
jgi:hypothetical protein